MEHSIGAFLVSRDDPEPDVLRILNDVFDRVDYGRADTVRVPHGQSTIIIVCGGDAEAEALTLLNSRNASLFVAAAFPDQALPSHRLRDDLAARGCLMVLSYSQLKDRDVMLSLRRAAVATIIRSAPFQQFRRMVEHARDVITVIDHEGTILYQSPSVQESLGYNPDDMIGRSFTLFVHPDDLGMLLSVLSKYGKVDGAAQTALYRFRHADGTWRELESHAAAKQLDGGSMEIIVTSRDVTHARQTVRDLEDRERQLSEAQRIAHLGSWRMPGSGDRMEWSSEMYRIFGFSVDSEVTRNRFLEAVHESDRPAVRNAFRTLSKERKRTEMSFRVIRTDGEVRHVRLLAEYAGGTGHVVGIVHDVTEAERSRLAFEISERRFRELFKLSPDAIVLLDEEGVIFDVNESACALLRRPMAQITGRTLIQFILPRDRPVVSGMIQGSPASTGSPQGPVHVLSDDGGGHAVTIHMNVVQENGSAIRLVYMRDEKDRIETEERLRDLSRHQGDLLERERMRISREVHDVLGQELTALRIDMSWIRKHLHDDAVLERIEQTEERARMAVETARRIAHELRPGILDDFGLAAAISWQARQFERRTGVTVHFVSAGPLDTPDDVSTAVFRIFQELLTNVARHAHATSVESTLTQSGHNLVLTVADDGRGMHIGRAEAGNSLGLMGIRERILPWDGRLELDSSPGKGTSISVTIPMRSDENTGR